MKDPSSNNGNDKINDKFDPIRLSDEAIKSGLDALGGPQALQGFEAKYETPDTLLKRAVIGLVKITGAIILATSVALIAQEALPQLTVLTASAKEALLGFSAHLR